MFVQRNERNHHDSNLVLREGVLEHDALFDLRLHRLLCVRRCDDGIVSQGGLVVIETNDESRA